MKRKSLFTLLFVIVACVSGCKEQGHSTAPTIYGIYSFHSSDSSIRHGTDILVINSDSTYVHFYANGSSGKQLVQDGTWKQGEGESIVFSRFVGWDLFGPTPDGVMYPDPANTAFPLRHGLNGDYEIDANSDRGEKFVQIERSNR